MVVDKFVNNETYSAQRGISLLSVYYPEMEDQNIIVEENLNMENGKYRMEPLDSINFQKYIFYKILF